MSRESEFRLTVFMLQGYNVNIFNAREVNSFMTETPDVTSPREVMALFKEYGLQPHKRLGQNFLIDGNTARKITAALEAGAGDAVVEVGPGAGALTVLLARSGVDLLALEVDRGLVMMLEKILEPWPKARVITQDALKVCWAELVRSNFGPTASVKLVSNLPYVISGPFMYSLFEAGFPFRSAVLMLQKEVAHRLVAEPGDSNYGALSVLSGYYTNGKVLFNVSNNVFWPRPKVGSSVLSLQPRKRILTADQEKLMWLIVQGVFQQRRKTMQNNLARLFPFFKTGVSTLLEAASINPLDRPEHLSASQFAKLVLIAYNYINKSS